MQLGSFAQFSKDYTPPSEVEIFFVSRGFSYFHVSGKGRKIHFFALGFSWFLFPSWTDGPLDIFLTDFEVTDYKFCKKKCVYTVFQLTQYPRTPWCIYQNITQTKRCNNRMLLIMKSFWKAVINNDKISFNVNSCGQRCNSKNRSLGTHLKHSHFQQHFAFHTQKI